jgi:hypothetical protein
VRLSTVSSAGSTGSSGSGTEDDTMESKQAPLLARKRTCPTSANSASRKPKNRRLTRKRNAARQQKRSPPRKKAAFSRPSDAGYSSEAQSSDTEVLSSKDSSNESGEESDGQDRHFRLRSRRIASRPVSWSRANAKNSSTTHAPLQADRKTRHVTKSIAAGNAEWYASSVTFHSLSADGSFLTALLRTCSGPALLSTSCAADVLENRLGQAIRLYDITIKLLEPDTWFLASFVGYPSDVDVSGRETCQPASAIPGLRESQPNDEASDATSDEISRYEYDNNSDKSDEYPSDIVKVHSSSMKYTPWSPDDDDDLRAWRAAGKSWAWIIGKFPGRSSGSIKTRWYTKLHKKA